MTAGPIAGTCVVDLSNSLAGAYCTKLLADAGADVIIVEPPGGVALRANKSLFAFLHTSKRSIVIDPDREADRQEVMRLLEAADLVVARGLERWLVDSAEALRARNPSLGLVTISWFGSDGPWADRPATEFTLQGWCGSIASRGRKHEPPVAAGGRIGEWAAGVSAAVAALALLREARTTGSGGAADVSVLEAMTIAFNQFQAVAAQMDGLGREPVPIARVVDVPSIEPTKDGWVGFATNGSAQFRSFAELVGHPEWADHPELGRVDRRPDHDRELRSAIADWTTRRSTAQILELASERRIPVAPVGNGETLGTIDYFVERGVFVRAPDGNGLQPRVPYRFADAPSRPLEPAPILGAHASDVRHALNGAPRTRRRAASSPVPEPASGAPCKGLRVFDLTSYWAGPYVGQILGFLGADVIKVESIQRPDGTRLGTAYASVGDQPWEMAPLFHGANTNKRGLTLDLSQPEGRALARRLLATCDVLVENYTPRVLDRFELVDDSLLESNPGLVVLRMPAWGLDGAWRDRPGFAQSMEQVTGLAWVTGFPDGPPIVPRGPCDPIGGLHAAFALLAVLEQRARTGRGTVIEAPLVESALNVAAAQIIESTRHGRLLTRQGNRGPDAAPQGVYRVAGEDCWVALAVECDDQWRALRRGLGDPRWSLDPTFDTMAGRQAAHDTLDAALCDELRPKDLVIVEQLCALGVPVAPVLNPRRTPEIDQLRARGFFEAVVHPVAGALRIPGFPARWANRVTPWHHRAAPTLGEHNEQILSEVLGLERDDICRLEREHIIGTRPVG
ncbi:MAG: CoA transferase [Acidimicrobiia bacterium]